MNFLFDLYGTLADIWTDEELPRLWQGVCLLLGEDVNEWANVKKEYATLCKEKKKSKYHEPDLYEVFSDMIEKRGVGISSAELAISFRRLSIIRLKLFPRIKELLTELRNLGAGVYLVSNAQACFTRPELDELGITRHFDSIVLSSEEGVKKPSAEIFRIAFERFGISAEDSYYVGNDMHDDVYGASGVGLKTVYIKTEQSGIYDEDELPAPDIVAKDHEDLYNILTSIASSNK